MAKFLYWLAPIYSTLIIILSLSDNPVKIVNVSNVDKVYHAGAYALMTILWYLFFYSRYLVNSGLGTFNIKTIIKSWSKVIAIAAAILCFVIGLLVELGQEYIAVNRTMDIYDAFANTTGIIIAVLILYLIGKKN